MFTSIAKLRVAFLPILFLGACMAGNPASYSHIASGLQDKTFYQTASSPGYLLVSYVYHRPDGTMTSWKQQNSPYGITRERRVGKWTAQEGKVCYSVKGKTECKNVNIDNGRLSMFGGELRNGDVGGTQRKNGVKVWQSAAVRNAKPLGQVIAETPFGAGLRAYGRLAAQYGGAAPAPSSNAPGKSYQCSIVCTNSSLASATSIAGDSRRPMSISVKAKSNSDARKRAIDARKQICEKAGFYNLTGSSVSCR